MNALMRLDNRFWIRHLFILGLSLCRLGLRDIQIELELGSFENR